MSYLIRNLLLLLAVVAAAFRPAVAQETAGGVQPNEPYRNLENFIDTMVNTHRSLLDVSAVTVSIVKDGELLLAKAYGMENREQAKPASADTSLFFVGSTSKLFTWTAVMQQVERGRLDLDWFDSESNLANNFDS